MFDQTCYTRTLPTMSTARFGERGDDVIYSFCFDHDSGALVDAVFVTIGEERFRIHYGEVTPV